MSRGFDKNEDMELTDPFSDIDSVIENDRAGNNGGSVSDDLFAVRTDIFESAASVKGDTGRFDIDLSSFKFGEEDEHDYPDWDSDRAQILGSLPDDAEEGEEKSYGENDGQLTGEIPVSELLIRNAEIEAAAYGAEVRENPVEPEEPGEETDDKEFLSAEEGTGQIAGGNTIPIMSIDEMRERLENTTTMPPADIEEILASSRRHPKGTAQADEAQDDIDALIAEIEREDPTSVISAAAPVSDQVSFEDDAFLDELSGSGKDADEDHDGSDGFYNDDEYYGKEDEGGGITGYRKRDPNETPYSAVTGNLRVTYNDTAIGVVRLERRIVNGRPVKKRTGTERDILLAEAAITSQLSPSSRPSGKGGANSRVRAMFDEDIKESSAGARRTRTEQSGDEEGPAGRKNQQSGQSRQSGGQRSSSQRGSSGQHRASQGSSSRSPGRPSGGSSSGSAPARREKSTASNAAPRRARRRGAAGVSSTAYVPPHEQNASAPTIIGVTRVREGRRVKKFRKASAGAASAALSQGKIRRRERNRKIRTAIISVIIWIIIILLCYYGYNTGYKVFNDTPIDPSDLSKITVTLEGDETDDEVGEMLLDLDMIDDLKIFKIRCKLYDSKYKTGEYEISRSYTTEKILNIFAGYVYSTGELVE